MCRKFRVNELKSKYIPDMATVCQTNHIQPKSISKLFDTVNNLMTINDVHTYWTNIGVAQTERDGEKKIQTKIK